MRRNSNKWMRDNSYPLFLCLVIFITSSINTYGQSTWEFDQQDLISYHALLDLKTMDLDTELNRDRNSTQYLKHFRNTIALLISDNENELDQYEKNTDEILDHFKKQKENTPYYKFYTAEVLLQSAFVHMKLGHEMSAGWELRKAYREIRRNIKAYPNFLPQYKTMGLLDIIIGSVPDKYNWLLTILGMEGSVIEGIKELTKLASSEDIFKTEATLLTLLMKGYILQENVRSVDGLGQLYNENSNSLLIGYLYVSVLMKSQKNEAALKVLDSLNTLSTDEYIQFSLLKYLKAEALLQKGSYSLAIKTYLQFIEMHQGQNYLKDANYKIGLAYWLQDQPELSSKYFETARNTGISLTEVDKHADKQLDNYEFPNRKIMEARLLTDGGYYENALEILDNIRSTNLTSKKDRIEVNYRKARIYHQTDQLNAAIAFYKLTINNVEKNDWYFAPNAALQLGFIYQIEDNRYLAEKYFKKALSYKDHEYKNSIDNKAKSGLSSLE